MESAHAEVFLLKEINRQHINRGIRVFGTVVFIDIARSVCQIEHGGTLLWLDTAIIDMTGVAIDSMFQFFGVLMSNDGLKVSLNAFTAISKS